MNQKRNFFYLLLLLFFPFLFSACRQSDKFTSSITPTSSSKPYFKLTTANNTAIMTMEATASEVTSTDNQTTYKNIAPNTDAIYKKIKNGIKEEIILSKAPSSPPVFKFSLDFGNLKPQYFEGQYYFFDPDGYARFTIPRPFMIDASGTRSEAVSLKIENNISTLTPDYNWLSDPKRVYPVNIDPSIVTPNFPLRELADKRTISAKTYDLGDGKYAATSGIEAIHYQDSNGKWQDKDTTIVPSSDPEYNFMNTTNNFQTYFSTDGFGQKKAVKFQVKDAWMKFKIINTSGSGQKDDIEDNKFEFKEIYKNDDKSMAATYTLQSDQLLEEVILNKFQGFPTIKQEIELHNAVLKPDGKKINAYHTTTNELLWTIPEPVMYELNRPDNRNYGLHYEISCQNTDCSNLILSKIIDSEGQSWLSDPNQNYPLVIDTTAGPNNPSTTAVDTSYGSITWNTYSNITQSDNSYAYQQSPSNVGATTYYLKGTNFGFSIPSGTTIDGIVAEIEKKQAGANNYYYAYDNRVSIVKSDGTIGTTDKRNINFYGTVDYYQSYGDSTDLWNESWTYTDINDTDFGLALSTELHYCPTGICYSLEPNSLISTPQGYKKIKNIKVGDKVFSYNEKTNKIEAKTVLNIYNSPISVDNNRYFYIYYQNKIIKATENHKFYVSGSYIRADKLKVGDKLLDTDLKKHPIEKIKIVKNYTDTVWDITVENNHNFFVENILTHNLVTAYIDHFRITVYYSDNKPIKFDGIKMDGIKIN